MDKSNANDSPAFPDRENSLAFFLTFLVIFLLINWILYCRIRCFHFIAVGPGVVLRNTVTQCYSPYADIILESRKGNLPDMEPRRTSSLILL